MGSLAIPKKAILLSMRRCPAQCFEQNERGRRQISDEPELMIRLNCTSRREGKTAWRLVTAVPRCKVRWYARSSQQAGRPTQCRLRPFPNKTARHHWRGCIETPRARVAPPL
jgi:hypothetical protein